LENLVHLYRRERDEQRRHLAMLESLSDRLRADAERVSGAIERASAIDDGTLTHPLIERHLTLACSLGQIETEILAARAVLIAAEHRLSRSERAAAQRGRKRLP
jgi:hypothetical protein